MSEETLAATADDLLGKRLRTQKFEITTQDEFGNDVVREVTVQALAAPDYDALLAEHPPTADQKKSGDTYNTDTFAPALISRCLLSPALSLEQAHAIWKSDNWSRGELRDLFLTCVNVCQRGLDVPFS